MKKSSRFVVASALFFALASAHAACHLESDKSVSRKNYVTEVQVYKDSGVLDLVTALNTSDGSAAPFTLQDQIGYVKSATASGSVEPGVLLLGPSGALRVRGEGEAHIVSFCLEDTELIKMRKISAGGVVIDLPETRTREVSVIDREVKLGESFELVAPGMKVVLAVKEKL